ncbi:hypothetical protein Tco_1008741 [Tanacetum coccineum]
MPALQSFNLSLNFVSPHWDLLVDSSVLSNAEISDVHNMQELHGFLAGNDVVVRVIGIRVQNMFDEMVDALVCAIGTKSGASRSHVEVVDMEMRRGHQNGNGNFTLYDRSN